MTELGNSGKLQWSFQWRTEQLESKSIWKSFFPRKIWVGGVSKKLGFSWKKFRPKNSFSVIFLIKIFQRPRIYTPSVEKHAPVKESKWGMIHSWFQFKKTLNQNKDKCSRGSILFWSCAWHACCYYSNMVGSSRTLIHPKRARGKFYQAFEGS